MPRKASETMVSCQWPPPEAAPAWPACCSLSSRKSTVTGFNAARRSRMTSAVARIIRAHACWKLSSRLGWPGLGGLVLDVFREPERLRDHEGEDQSDAAEHLEVDPRVEREVERDPEVERALENEEKPPRHRELGPHVLRELDAFAHHRTGEVGLEEERHEEGRARQAVEHRRLPLDEGLVAQDQRRAPEDHDDREARPLHVRHLLAAREHPSDLHHGRADRHRGRDEDVRGLEGHEKQDQGEEVEEELHEAWLTGK